MTRELVLEKGGAMRTHCLVLLLCNFTPTTKAATISSSSSSSHRHSHGLVELHGYGDLFPEWLPLMAFLLLCFYTLALTAHLHFSPVVSLLAKSLRLSPTAGAVTLLALGNGAPDVFASMASVSSDHPRIGLGAVLSAGFFVTAFVVGVVSLAASPFPVQPLPFVRDVCFYLLAVATLFFIYLRGEVYFWEALALVGLYIAFAVLVLGMDFVNGKARAPNFSMSDANQDQNHDRNHSRTSTAVDRQQGDDFQARDPMGSYTNSTHILSNGLNYADAQSLDVEATILPPASKQSKKSRNLAQILLVGLVSPLFNCLCKECCAPRRIFKLELLWQVPINVILRSTIPAVDPSNWNRFYASANIVFCPLIVLYIISSAVSPHRRIVFLVPGINLPLWSVILLQGSVLGVAYFFSAKEPPKNVPFIAVVIAFVMSVFWISFIAGQLLSCLAAVGVVLKLPPALLGLTVLAWGNSIGDLVADVAVARAGQPAMAMAGCFAGPMFNMLVGFGLALAMKCAHLYPSPYHLEYSRSIVTAFGFLFTSLLTSLFVVTRSKFQVPRYWGFCLISLYIIFVVFSLSTANLI